MKKKQKLLALFFLIVAVFIAGLFLLNRNTAATTETQEINEFVAQANINKINEWAIHPNCGEAGGKNDGYLLQVNNIGVTSGKAAELKSLASNRDYIIKDRDDGYEIENDNWNIIVLNKNRADLFITIQYPEKPKGFPEESKLCS